MPPASTRQRVEQPCPAAQFRNSLGTCVPLAWTCGPMFYAGGRADGCDCDCGAPDPDCGLPGVAFYCHPVGTVQQVNNCSACATLPSF